MIDIPKYMGNEESRLVAAVVVTERDFLIADANHLAAKARLRKFYETKQNGSSS